MDFRAHSVKIGRILCSAVKEGGLIVQMRGRASRCQKRWNGVDSSLTLLGWPIVSTCQQCALKMLMVMMFLVRWGEERSLLQEASGSKLKAAHSPGASWLQGSHLVCICKYNTFLHILSDRVSVAWQRIIKGMWHFSAANLPEFLQVNPSASLHPTLPCHQTEVKGEINPRALLRRRQS